MTHGYFHGWQGCRKCHGAGSALTSEGRWLLRANPGYWGDAAPSVLVLGFSKGANQERASLTGSFDGVAFANARTRLREILGALDVDLDGQTMDDILSASGRGVGVASLVRCGLSMEKNAKLVTSGTVMTDAVRDSWTRAVMQRCIAAHLVDMPATIRTVVLLGNDDRYIAGVKSVMRTTFGDYTEVNEVAFRANDRVWVFAAHPAPGNGHLHAWLRASAVKPQGRKRMLARTALGLSADAVDAPTPLFPADTPVNSRDIEVKDDMANLSSDDEAGLFAHGFYLEHESGARLFPKRMRNRDTGRFTFRVSRAGNTKDDGREVHDENELYKLYEAIAAGTYAVRAAALNSRGPTSLLQVGVRSIRRAVKL